ncbi:MAG: phospholipid methyltransferase [Methylocystis sp.]|nr:MAG: phospholipid methyltransferase [Methylocystis sp.]
MSLARDSAAIFEKTAGPALLFLKRWMANPLVMGSITPSSASLARVIARNVRREEDEAVVEFGGGTGSVTRALLESGVPASRLFSVEIDPELAAYLRREVPGVTVLEGDARRIREMLPNPFVGKVGTVIVGIPMVLLPSEAQQSIVDEIFSIMPKGRRFLALTYAIGAPLKYEALGLNAKRVGFTPANIPPASVWAFWKR